MRGQRPTGASERGGVLEMTIRGLLAPFFVLVSFRVWAEMSAAEQVT